MDNTAHDHAALVAELLVEGDRWPVSVHVIDHTSPVDGMTELHPEVACRFDTPTGRPHRLTVAQRSRHPLYLMVALLRRRESRRGGIATERDKGTPRTLLRVSSFSNTTNPLARCTSR